MTRISVSRSQHGFSLVELLVAAAIALIVSGIIAALFVGARHSARYQEAVARLQETGRLGIELIARSVRNAGYRVCGSGSGYANVVNSSDGWWYALDAPLFGLEGTDTAAPVLPDAAPGTDAIFTVGVDAGRDVLVTGHASGDAAVFHTAPHSIPVGSILVASDCRHTAVFQMTGPNRTNQNTPHDTVVHNSGTGSGNAQPGNCKKRLGNGCAVPASIDYTFAPGSTVSLLAARAFYIAAATSGNGNALWAHTLVSGGQLQAQELLEGVDDLQIEYGEDTDQDGVANRYVSADSVSSWSTITSVRLHLLARNAEDNLATGVQTYNHAGRLHTADDRRIRRSFTTVINVRNRSL